MAAADRTQADHVLTHDSVAVGAASAYYQLMAHTAVATIHKFSGLAIINVIQGRGLIVGGINARVGRFCSSTRRAKPSFSIRQPTSLRVRWELGDLAPQPVGVVAVVAAVVGLCMLARRRSPRLFILWAALGAGAIAISALPR
jgi:hypothetical protein